MLRWAKEAEMAVQRVSIVTGGGGGIGRETAIRLAARGDRVAVWDLRLEAASETAAEIGAGGGEATAAAVDVTDPTAIDAARDAVLDRWGAISHLVSGAGYSQPLPFGAIDLARWNAMLAVHATAAFLCCSAVAPTMSAARYGRIVLMSSLAGLSGNAGHVHYAAAKAAMIGFAKALARELGPDGITVNAIAPGTIDTPMLGVFPDAIRERTSGNAMGRLGTPADVARAVRFLTEEDADYITGTVVNISGGLYT
jgi:NAD(P)-dependent dehydrogenase (short-subunit alcohol dehydrogenase family)